MIDRKGFIGSGIIIVAVSSLFLLFVLAQEVADELAQLRRANSDNVQWSLTQAEVEVLELQETINGQIGAPAPNLAKVRTGFDIFYSRIKTVSEGQFYSSLRASPEFASEIAVIDAFLQRSVAVIDAPDHDLAADLETLARDVGALRPHVRAMSVAGLSLFAKQADIQREGISQTLTRLAMVTLALLAVLMLVVLSLLQQVRKSGMRALKLERTSKYLDTVVNASLDAIIVAGPDGRIREINMAAETIFGCERKKMLTRKIGETIVPEKYRDAHATGMARLAETGEKRVVGTGRIQLEAQRSDGTIFPVEMAIHEGDDDTGKIYIAYLRDISHRVKAERDLIEARDRAVAGDKAKTEFLAVMSHELRTPLNGLLGTLSLMHDTRLSAKQKSYVETMQASGGVLLHHINNVLDITKYDAGNLRIDRRPTDLDALVQTVVDNQRDLAAAADNVVHWHWCSEPARFVQTDPDRLSQVLLNLVGNAVKFTRHGEISIELEVTQAEECSDLMIRVIDTGIGIDPDDIERVFRDFETGDTSYGRIASGTGLGLGIARRIVTALGGEIGAESDPGDGSVFWVRVPVRQIDAPAPVPVQKVAKAGRKADRVGRKSILVVEDNEINRTVLRDMLSADGHQVTEAHNGIDGVSRAAHTPFDLILMDISMPVMDGVEATRSIRTSSGPNRTTPIWATTAHALPVELERFRSEGFTGSLTKPIDRGRLRDLLADRIESGALVADADSDLPAGFQALAQEFGAERARDLHDRFAKEAKEIIAGLQASGHEIAARETTARQAHKLAGSASVFGYADLLDRLHALEAAAKSGADSGTLHAAVADVVAAWSAIRADD